MNRSPLPERGLSRLRAGRTSEIGRSYLVTFCTARRAALFHEHGNARAFVRSLYGPSLLRQSMLLCWVLMPDHWHALVELGPADSLSTLVGRIKGATARGVNGARSMSGRVWAEGFHDHAVRKEEDLLSIARYVICNPVRAGLVPRVGEYPYWNAVWLHQEHRG